MSGRAGMAAMTTVWGMLFLAGAAGASAQDPLLEAIRQADAPAVSSLLSEGADPNAAQGDGLSALHIAAEEGYVEIVRVLLDAGARVDARTLLSDYTPLHLASQNARADVVRALVEGEADVAASSGTTGATPLHLAARALKGEEVVRILLESGAPADARESAAGQTPLMFASAFGRAAAVRELLGHGAIPALASEVVDALEEVFIDDAAETKLRDALGQIREDSPTGSDQPLTASEVQAAISAGREFLGSEEMRQMLGDFEPDDLAQTVPTWTTQGGLRSETEIVRRPMFPTLVGKSGGMTGLHYAARAGHIEVVDVLLDGGADIDQVSGDGASALVIALLNGHFDLAMVLIEHGADPNLLTHDDGVSALFAVLNTQWRLMFPNHPHPRAHETQEAEYMEVLNALLAAGADPNVPLKTHLWHSEYFEQKLGLDLTAATPFWRAALALDVEAMKALAAHGADPNLPTRLPEPGMRYTGRVTDGRQQDDSGLPVLPEGTPDAYPIHAAAGVGYMGLGAFMMNSVPNNFLNAVKYLVEENGADVNVGDAWGYTPLHYAAVRGGNDLIEYLVSKGADVTAISRLGQTPADMARGGRAGYFSRTAYPETVELLRDLGSPLRCLDTMFRGTGDYCPVPGVAPFETEKVEKTDE